MPLSPGSFKWWRPLARHSQAFLQVRLIGTTSTTPIITTLLDTGAAYSGFDANLAQQAGFVLANLPVVTIKLASGALVRMRALNNVNLEIEGKRVLAKRVLLLNANATPILATKDLLVRTDFGVDGKALYFD